MADLITWKTVTAPSVAAELAEARKAQEGIGAAFEGVGSQLEDYAATKQKRQTDAFIADLNLAKNEDERNEMISAAKSGWLNMERITDASRDATKFGMEKELHTDQMGTNLAEREHIKAEDEYNKAMLDAQTKSNEFDRENAEKVAKQTLDFRKNKILLDKTVADKQKAAAEQALTTANEEAAFNALKRKEWEGTKDVRLGATQAELRAQKKAARQDNNLKIFNEKEAVIANLPTGSKESVAAIKALRDQLTGPIKDGVGGMDLTTFNNKIRPHREANLAASVGFGDESYQKILDYGFVPNPVNELGQPLDRPPLAAFTSYEAMLRRVLTNDPKNKGISKTAIEAKLNQILNTPEYITGKKAATHIQESIDLVEKEREDTQAEISANNEAFHVEVKNSTAANHIIALLDKNYSHNYNRKIITEEQLRAKIQTTLDRVNKIYGATTPKLQSAYARAVYKLFSMSQAESGGIGVADIIGIPGTQGEIWFGGETSARTMGMVDLSLEKLPDNKLSEGLSPHLLTRHQDTAAAKKEAAMKALSGKKEKKTEEQILLDKLKLPKQEHQIDRYIRKQKKQVR